MNNRQTNHPNITCRNFLSTLGLGVGMSMASASVPFSRLNDSVDSRAGQDKPNIIIIMADDMGFSDIGCYGGEIQTPNIDHLAANGLSFLQFYNTARCCPTRASLLTGLHPHQTGIGHMTNTSEDPKSSDKEVFGYRGFLNRRCVTLAEVLKTAGYHTLMSGKWHVGQHGKEKWPLQRGFDRYYGIISGATNYFHPQPPDGLTLGNEHIDPEGKDYYITDAFTDYAIRFVKEAAKKDNNPFFLYLAYTAPHWPLHAKKKDIDKYRGKYMKGWDKLREERHQRMIDMGIVKKEWPLSPRDARAWEKLNEEKKKEMDLRMAIYAAQVDCMDQNVGRLLRTLEDLGKLDNTLIMFLSDNGGCAEVGELGGGKASNLEKDRGEGCTYGRAWANASNTPFRRYKHWVHEGGMATPLVVHWPNSIEDKGVLRKQLGYLPDFMATCVDVSGATYPTQFHGNDIPPMEGKSLVPAFANKPIDREAMYWEHEGNRAIRVGDWKLVSAYWEYEGDSMIRVGNWRVVSTGQDGEWELYNLKEDRTELEDLTTKESERAKGMAKLWDEWAERCHVKLQPSDTSDYLFRLLRKNSISSITVDKPSTSQIPKA